MSASAVSLAEEGTPGFYGSTIGKKVVMAVSGAILFLFVIGHLIGNLQFFLGSERLNSYSRFLHGSMELLWGVRVLLLIMVAAHIWSAVLLAVRKTQARPVKYTRKKAAGSSYASRTMYWSGPIIAAFVVYHLLDFTTGTLNPGYQQGLVYENVVRSFQAPAVAIFYIFAMALLCLHLYHGAWSMFQTIGVSQPRHNAALRTFAAVISIAIFFGFSSIPFSVLTGLKS